MALSFDDVLLVPQRTPVATRSGVSLASSIGGLSMHLPFISANTPWCTGPDMALAIALVGGLGCIHRAQLIEAEAESVLRVKNARPELSPHSTLDQHGRLAVAACVGINGDYLERAAALVEAGVDLLAVDVAHAHSDHFIDAVKKVREVAGALPLMGGNVATASAVRDLANAGVNHVKVGIGPGGVCTTRLVAGAGVPQLTALLECSEAAQEAGVSIIADGGIRRSGDAVKALAAGAEQVMLGSFLAGCDESAAISDERGPVKVRRTTGFATKGMQAVLAAARGEEPEQREDMPYVPEGVEVLYEATGPIRDRLWELAGGIRSGVSYGGASDLASLRMNAQFVRVTSAGLAEGSPHAAT